MGVPKGVQNLGNDPEGHVRLQMASLFYQSLEGLSFDILHDDEIDIPLLGESVYGDDVGMVEPCLSYGLDPKPVHQLRVSCQLGRDDFDRHFALESEVFGQIDRPQPSLPQEPDTAVIA